MEEAREARADFPDEERELFEGQRHEPAPVRREAARRRPLLVALEHVQPGRRLQVVHHDGALARADGQPLRGAVEVDRRIAGELVLDTVDSEQIS